MPDAVLSRYRQAATKRTKLSFPRFADEAKHTAPILAILQTPGKSGAVDSGACSLDNKDPTAKRTARIIRKIRLQREKIIFWNFHAAYETGKRANWAREIEALVGLLPRLKVVIAFGDQAWRGMRDVELPDGVILVGAPHPSNRSCYTNPNAEGRIKRAWQRAKVAAARKAYSDKSLR